MPHRILQITRIAKGGVAVVLDQLARGFETTGHYVPVVIFDTPQDSDIRKQLVSSSIQTIEMIDARDILAEQVASRANRDNTGKLRVGKYLGEKGYPVYLSMKSAWKFFSRELPKVKEFFDIIKEQKISLVHTHSDLCRAKPEIVAAKLAGIPCITHRHGYSTYTWFDRLFASLVEANIYISNDVSRHHIIQGEKQEKGVVIHNGVNIADYNQKYDEQEIRQEFGCKADQPLIGLVARLDWWKGHEYFIEAMAEVTQQHKNSKGLIIGGIAELHYNSSQQYLDKLHKMVQSLELQDQIIFTGHRNDIPRLLSALDVVVHASSTPEPFGLTVIEGMAMGKPVVATAAGGVLDIIEDGVSGLLVPCRDSKAMAGAILQCLTDKEIAKQMGSVARKRVRGGFSLRCQLAAIQSLYDNILHGDTAVWLRK